MANDTARHFVGASPGATVHVYRVFGCRGSVGSDVLIEAMLYAALDGVDVLSLSLAGLGGWPDSPMAAVASRIAARGIRASKLGVGGAFVLMSQPRAVTIANGQCHSYGWICETASATCYTSIWLRRLRLMMKDELRHDSKS